MFTECCCRHKKPTIPPDFDASANVYSIASDFNTTANSSQPQIGQHSLPQINYDEIDPPPSYAALFPNQKITNESNGISSSATEEGLPSQPQPITN